MDIPLDTTEMSMSNDQTLDTRASTHLSIREAADDAGVSEKTIRRWIQAHRLPAEKIGGQYQIDRSDLAIMITRSSVDTPRPGVHRQRLDTGHPMSNAHVPWVDTGQTDVQTPVQVGIDIRPLVDHIATLEGKVQQLTEAATTWQIRAFQLEEQLKQLTAGGVEEPESPTMPLESSQNDAGATKAAAMTPDTLHEPSLVASWFARLFRRS